MHYHTVTSRHVIAVAMTHYGGERVTDGTIRTQILFGFDFGWLIFACVEAMLSWKAVCFHSFVAALLAAFEEESACGWVIVESGKRYY